MNANHDRPLDDSMFDAAIRAHHQAALERLSPRAQAQLAQRRNAALRGESMRRGYGFRYAAAGFAAREPTAREHAVRGADLDVLRVEVRWWRPDPTRPRARQGVPRHEQRRHRDHGERGEEPRAACESGSWTRREAHAPRRRVLPATGRSSALSRSARPRRS